MVAITRSILLAGVLLSVAACASPPHQTETATQLVSAPVCPDALPSHPAAGPASPMVPGTPAAAVVCHYGPQQPNLIKSAQVSDVKGLQSALNSADTAPPPRGVMCPMDDGRTDLVIFAYADGGPVDVTVKPTGCATATNGTAKAYRLTGAVLNKL
ncbi:hypothetical protein [Kutzneria kofuensis]|uniref:Subtilisin inhibitor-like n=1 Tax=Kutzneria kofuensis TaxID=103725 RepID=A0A7W9NMP0_9PSEU|nr:hypothetical protein [Kutzneria kofuensis]MBB5897741.1 hypothetical protein [Kutzneria kofuensis]